MMKRNMEYMTGFAQRNGYSGVAEYREALARKKGFKNIGERKKAYLLSRGFETEAEYEDYLAQKKGYKNRWNRKKDRLSASNKKWRDTHKEEIKNSQKEWRQSPEGKLSMKKHKNEHHRKFGFNPLNESFEGSDAHHIDMINVIFVSKEINHIYHKQENERSMTYVNILAWTEMETGAL